MGIGITSSPLRDYVSLIRSEINEDNYHSSLAEADYWDDSHTWGDDDRSASNNYWHFLGLYE
ncbi:MAG: hypothetical protein HC764_20510 [Pleurocapsa sp. CRU_1_2]|nr:hypothetical protein [Pleurocapsa sp. CRU_1_2]